MWRWLLHSNQGSLDTILTVMLRRNVKISCETDRDFFSSTVSRSEEKKCMNFDTREKFKNAALFLRLGRTSTLIRHRNGAVRKPGKLPAVRFHAAILFKPGIQSFVVTLCVVCLSALCVSLSVVIIVSPIDKTRCFWGKQWLISLNK